MMDMPLRRVGLAVDPGFGELLLLLVFALSLLLVDGGIYFLFLVGCRQECRGRWEVARLGVLCHFLCFAVAFESMGKY